MIRVGVATLLVVVMVACKPEQADFHTRWEYATLFIVAGAAALDADGGQVFASGEKRLVVSDMRTLSDSLGCSQGRGEALVDILDCLGLDRWELVSSNALVSGRSGATLYYFKRPVLDAHDPNPEA